jgi:hypothetical protein
MLVAHNMAFDSRMMMAEMCNADLPPSLLNSLRPFCTMEAMTPIMAMPGKYGKPKWPKLLEAHLHCFGTGIQNAHNALADTMACRAIYYHGREMGWWTQKGPSAGTVLSCDWNKHTCVIRHSDHPGETFYMKKSRDGRDRSRL